MLALATRRRVPVVPRGAGSNLCAATVPLRGGIVLVLTRLNAILEVSADELLARVQPGVTSAALADAAAAQGLLWAPDPGSRTVATDRRHHRHLRGRAARPEVRRDPQLRAGPGGGAAHRRGDPHRRPAVEGRRRLRPDPAAHRLRGHPRRDHRGDRGAAARPGVGEHRGRVLPDAGRRGRGGRPGDPGRGGAGDAGVPRPGLHRRRGGLRPPGAARRRRGAAALRRRRRRPTSVAAHLAGSAQPASRPARWRSPRPARSPRPRRCWPPAAARCRRCPGGAG